jgi:hypothetical protein
VSDLAKLRAIVEAMTSGPWSAIPNGIGREGPGLVVHGGGLNDRIGIAALRNYGIELIAVAEAAEQDRRDFGARYHLDVGPPLAALFAKLEGMP